LLGHIFFDTVGKDMSDEDCSDSSDSDSENEEEQPSSIPLVKRDPCHGGDVWTLQDYHAILDLKDDDEERPTTIGETKKKIQTDLHINLFDLLNWFRNPDTSHRPQRFNSIEDLAEYSYTNNKVFPRYNTEESRVANPLLRPIGWNRYSKLMRRAARRKTGTPRGEIGTKSSMTVVAEAVTAESEGVDNKIDADSKGEGSQENTRPRRNWGRGRRQVTKTGESESTSIEETPVVAATA
jgi:hypothetical protein